ncbi:DUF4149 domain-containing protein [Helicobacter cholecystus]|uniref:DUF4149 domain-containing protein n=1 Tax=Helicobacter cholecystus TaxID=45498 RepID=UPI00273A280D|nr:DUF4149 domain-containing protein [Helicobacter cholecystus]
MQKIYQFLLAGIIGIELILGIVVAPAIFYPKDLDEILSHFQSGIIMSHIFSQFGYILLGVSGFCLLYELLNYKGAYLRILLNLGITVLSIIFVFYFCSYIIQAQALGESATITPHFQEIHTWSEYTLKAILVFQCILFFTPFPTRRFK